MNGIIFESNMATSSFRISTVVSHFRFYLVLIWTFDLLANKKALSNIGEVISNRAQIHRPIQSCQIMSNAAN